MKSVFFISCSEDSFSESDPYSKLDTTETSSENGGGTDGDQTELLQIETN